MSSNTVQIDSISAWHDSLLTLAIDWREQHPEFTFNLRKTEMAGKSRLRDGYWFTGTDQYLFFAPYRPGDRDNKTRTIGFVIQFDAQQRPKRCDFEVVFGNLEDPSLLEVHERVRSSFEMEQVGAMRKYRLAYPVEGIEGTFQRFLSEDLPRIRGIIESAGMGDRFFVSELEFNKMLQRTLGIRQARSEGELRLCLIGTWSGASEARIDELGRKIAEHGVWSSDWSFSLKQTARDRLRSPFYLYLNIGGNRIRYRLRIEAYEASPDSQGFASSWPEVTDSDRLQSTFDLNGKTQPLLARFKVSGVDRLERDLNIDDFVPALDTESTALRNQAAFGYAFLRTEIPVKQSEIFEAASALGPVNQILYGPPGTGKTWWLQQKLSEYTDSEGHVDRASWTLQLLTEVGWRPVIAAALAALGGTARAPEIRDHALTAQKAQLNGRSPKHMLPTIWGFLLEHTSPDCVHVRSAIRRKPFLFDKSKDGRWSLVANWQEQDTESSELARHMQEGPGADTAPAKRYRVVTFHPSFGYEDFIRGIRPTVDGETGEARFSMVDGVFKQICDQARANPSQRYALFIDEINRANIAKVFGELITLIEIDKRAEYDADARLVRGMEVQLPGSVDDTETRSFGVPVNLDLYGTMNTADRSIALLDIALRRRFEFIECEPKYDVLKETIEGIDLGLLLSRINERLEYLLDRDHRIGHAYFIHLKTLVELQTCFAQKILPLLQEYFFDDASRVAMVLATAVRPGFLRANAQDPERLFPVNVELGRLQLRTRYIVTPQAGWTSVMFRGIYEAPLDISEGLLPEDEELEPETLDD